MTREEAIEILQKIKPIPHRGDGKSTTHILETIALDMAIKALEQQPCDDDCISRDDVLTNLRLNWRLYESAEDAIKMSIYDVSNMDIINPKQAKAEIEKEESAKDCISREAVDEYITNLLSGYLYDEERTRLEDLTAFVWELPSVTPTRPTGKWKKYLDEGGFLYCECLNCGHITNESDNYCPNCGTRMAESEDKER